MDVQTLELKSIHYRRAVLKMIKNARTGHTGGSLSCIDILNVLYNQVMHISPQNFHDPNRDRYVHSKGHSVEALYAVLADQGFFPAGALDTLGQPGSAFIGHPTRKIPGIEQNTGSLGHGLSFGVGLALAAKMDERPVRVFVLTGDGELTEGSLWEAAMSAAHYHLDNLTIIIDRNTLQITGRTEEVMSLEPLAGKFSAFGCAVCEVDGHDLHELSAVLNRLPFQKGKPSLVLAKTIKGKGVSFIEDQVDWHHHVPTGEEYAAALQELDAAQREWQERYESTSIG